MSRIRRFLKTEEEIIHLLNESDSEDDNDNIKLDNEDLNYLEDFDALENGTEIVIEDVIAGREAPSSPPRTFINKKPEYTFKWKKINGNYDSPSFAMNKDVEYSKVLRPQIGVEDEIP